MHGIKQNIIELHAKRLYSVEQDKFLCMLLTGKSGQNGWRNFNEIIKAPTQERKLGRIEAALFCEHQKTSWWHFYSQYKLNKIKAVISHLDLSKPEKIAQIKLLMNDFPDSKRTYLLLINKEINSDLAIEEEFNDIDHLIQAISNEVLNKQQTTRSYRNGLIKIRTQLQTLQDKQVMSWAVNLQSRLFPSWFDLINHKTSTQFNGTLMLPIRQGYDYRLGDSGGECFGYAADWCRSMLENAHYNNLSHDAEPSLKPLKAGAFVAKRYPDLNHLAPLTRDISDFQMFQGNTRQLEYGMSSKENTFDFKKKIWTYFFTSSVKHAAKQLISEVNSKPDIALMFGAKGYRSGHMMGFCKKNNAFHFYDSNFAWVRFNKADDFEKWLPFYFDKTGYSHMFGEYQISSFEKRTPDVMRSKETNLGFLNILVLLPFIIPLCVVLLFYMLVIRGVYYVGRSLVSGVTSLFKKPTKEDDQYIVEHEEKAQNTIDDLSFFMASKPSKEQTVNMHNAAGLLFKDPRLLELKPSASDIGFFAKKAKDDIDLVAPAENYAFQP